MPASGLDEILSEFCPNPMDLNIEQVRHGLMLGVEQLFIEGIARQRLSLPLREDLHQRILTSR